MADDRRPRARRQARASVEIGGALHRQRSADVVHRIGDDVGLHRRVRLVGRKPDRVALESEGAALPVSYEARRGKALREVGLAPRRNQLPRVEAAAHVGREPLAVERRGQSLAHARHREVHGVRAIGPVKGDLAVVVLLEDRPGRRVRSQARGHRSLAPLVLHRELGPAPGPLTEVPHGGDLVCIGPAEIGPIDGAVDPVLGVARQVSDHRHVEAADREAHDVAPVPAQPRIAAEELLLGDRSAERVRVLDGGIVARGGHVARPRLVEVTRLIAKRLPRDGEDLAEGHELAVDGDRRLAPGRPRPLDPVHVGDVLRRGPARHRDRVRVVRIREVDPVGVLVAAVPDHHPAVVGRGGLDRCDPADVGRPRRIARAPVQVWVARRVVGRVVDEAETRWIGDHRIRSRVSDHVHHRRRDGLRVTDDHAHALEVRRRALAQGVIGIVREQRRVRQIDAVDDVQIVGHVVLGGTRRRGGLDAGEAAGDAVHGRAVRVPAGVRRGALHDGKAAGVAHVTRRGGEAGSERIAEIRGPVRSSPHLCRAERVKTPVLSPNDPGLAADRRLGVVVLGPGRVGAAPYDHPAVPGRGGRVLARPVRDVVRGEAQGGRVEEAR